MTMLDNVDINGTFMTLMVLFVGEEMDDNEMRVTQRFRPLCEQEH